MSLSIPNRAVPWFDSSCSKSNQVNFGGGIIMPDAMNADMIRLEARAFEEP